MRLDLCRISGTTRHNKCGAAGRCLEHCTYICWPGAHKVLVLHGCLNIVIMKNGNQTRVRREDWPQLDDGDAKAVCQAANHYGLSWQTHQVWHYGLSWQTHQVWDSCNDKPIISQHGQAWSLETTWTWKSEMNRERRHTNLMSSCRSRPRSESKLSCLLFVSRVVLAAAPCICTQAWSFLLGGECCKHSSLVYIPGDVLFLFAPIWLS